MDVWNDTTAGNGSLDQSVKLFISPDCKQQVSWCDSLDLQVLGGIACKFKDLGSEILEDGGTVHGRSSTDSAVGTDS